MTSKKLGLNAFSATHQAQIDYMNARDELNHSIQKESNRLYKKYPMDSLISKPFLYLFYGHLSNMDIRGIDAGDLSSDFSIRLEMSNGELLKYLKSIDKDGALENMKVENPVIYNTFFSATKYLIAMRPYDNQGNLPQTPYHNTGAYVVSLD